MLTLLGPKWCCLFDVRTSNPEIAGSLAFRGVDDCVWLNSESVLAGAAPLKTNGYSRDSAGFWELHA